MLSSVLSNSVPSLRRTISDYGLRSKSKSTDMIVHRRSESTEMVLTQTALEISPELKCKLSLHGFNLLQASLAESSGNNPNSRAFSRQLYLDSVAYLIQGLPTDLTKQEAYQIRKVIPHEVQPAQLTDGRRIPHGEKAPSFLHRSLSSSIVYLCLFLRLFLPYIRYIVAAAYRYERNYRISEKVFSTTMSATDSVGRKAIEVASTALGSQVVVESVAYCVDGVCGGVTEGLGQGLRAMEIEKVIET